MNSQARWNQPFNVPALNVFIKPQFVEQCQQVSLYSALFLSQRDTGLRPKSRHGLSEADNS